MAIIEVADGRHYTRYTLDEAAKQLGVCYMTVWRKVHTGSVRSVRVGRSHLVRLEDLEPTIPKSSKR